jgi:opacity protein-like surface antigen
MLRTLVRIASLACLIFLPAIGHSQAMPTATGSGGLQAGVGWTYAKPDYGQKSIQGITFFGDLNLSPHIGAEAEYHYVALITPTDIGENSFFAGPRFILPRGRFRFYAKALLGVGSIVLQDNKRAAGAGTYFAYAAGGGVDYQISRRWVARGDYEFRHWSYLSGLTPSAITVGAAYRFR